MSLPLPSSPHWVPTTTVAGTRHSSVTDADYTPVYPSDRAPPDGRGTARTGPTDPYADQAQAQARTIFPSRSSTVTVSPSE